MTHTRSYSELEGTLGEPEPATRLCFKCGSKDVVHQLWQSNDGGYEDDKYTCKSCGFIWWVEGIDS
jgi:DNA-directed RNA polymerase subunit M/transcription elongation factor TFIIS